MTEREEFIIDASVATKWYLNDEEFSLEASKLLTAYQEERVGLVAPDHIRYEVPSAISNAIRTDRIDPEKAREQIANFLYLGLPTITSSSLILLAHDCAVRYGCSLYDGLYVALAEMSLRPVIHADRNLRNTLRGRCPQELWIADYDP